MAPTEVPASLDGAGDARDLLGDVIWPRFEFELNKLKRIKEWSSQERPEFLVPSRTSKEKRALLNLAKTPWLSLVVETFTQSLLVDGYRTKGSTDNVAGPWSTWTANGFTARQMAIHRAALRYGYAYGRALLGQREDGDNKALLRGLSPTRCFALYDDPVADDYPRYAVEWLQDGYTCRLYDENFHYDIPMPNRGEFPANEPIVMTPHGSEVVPIVRYLNMMDLDGFVKGEVEDLIPVAASLDKTKFDRLLIQHFNSWRVRWATGLDSTQADDPEQFFKELSQSSTLASTSEATKFGTLDATPMGDVIAAYVRDIGDLEDAAQLPPRWSGGVSNVGPDALEELRDNTRSKIIARQVTFGDAHNRLLRLAANLEGNQSDATDLTGSVTWVDADIRSLGQAMDAWGKAHAMLGVPARALWKKLVSPEEAASWETYFESKDPMDKELKYWGDPAGSGGPPPTAPPPVAPPALNGVGANAPQPNRLGAPPA